MDQTGIIVIFFNRWLTGGGFAGWTGLRGRRGFYRIRLGLYGYRGRSAFLNKVFGSFKNLQAGATTHHATGSIQMLIANAKAGLAMWAAGYVNSHDRSLTFNPCKNNPITHLFRRVHDEPLSITGRDFVCLLGQQAGQSQFTTRTGQFRHVRREAH